MCVCMRGKTNDFFFVVMKDKRGRWEVESNVVCSFEMQPFPSEERKTPMRDHESEVRRQGKRKVAKE